MRPVLEIAKTYIDYPTVLRSGVGEIPSFRTYVIERPENASNVKALRMQSPALHSLDLSTTKGSKFVLLRDLIADNPASEDEWIVISDDDVEITRGNLGRFVAIASQCEFDVAQPGHDRRGFVNFGITASKPLARARLTTLVEIGPIFAVSPSSHAAFLSTLPGIGMGWGLEAIWWKMGLRLGIVDEVRMRHLVRAGVDYDMEQAARDRDELVRQVHRITDVQPHDTLKVLWAWQSVRRCDR